MWPLTQGAGNSQKRRTSGVANEAQCPVVGPGLNVPSNQERNMGLTLVLNHSTRKQSHKDMDGSVIRASGRD